MIVVLKDNPDKKQLDNLVSWLKSMGLDIHFSEGQSATIMGLIGDTSAVDIDLINALDIVDTVKRVQEPYKNVNRKFHPEDYRYRDHKRREDRRRQLPGDRRPVLSRIRRPDLPGRLKK